MNFFKQIFTWWNRQTTGTMILTIFSGKLKGIDEFGNKYYESKTGKRWVIYKDLVEASNIPPNWYSSALAVHVVWALPFGYLVMMAVFNRFDSRLEEAARDMGANEWTVFKEVTLPLITPGIVAAGLFGFTLSYDEFARTTLLAGAENTLPLDINASMTQRIRPTLFALGTASTLFSLIMISVFLGIYTILYRRSR